jgi:SAM-dependent methyltransferase
MRLLRSPLALPLDEAFRDVLNAEALRRKWPTTADVDRLAQRVRALSEAYNSPESAPSRGPESLAARLLFSFPRDVPKGAAAVRELVSRRALRIPEGRALRILDVGAGLGAMTRGVVRALAAAGERGIVAIDALDDDKEALDLAAAIARARPTEGEVSLELRRVLAPAEPPLAAAGSYDLVVFGQVLSELGDTQRQARLERHVRLIHAGLDRMAEGGAIVIVEPALRERTRALHALRDALCAQEGALVSVIAPCVHNAPCPVLRTEGDWCHEDLDVDLPAWLVPVARAAGLRFQGLTFSYLVLGESKRARGRPNGALRVVSSPIVSKGKRELFLCGPFDDSVPERRRVMRLSRHESPANAAWDDAVKGDEVVVLPPLSAQRPRVTEQTRVERVREGGRAEEP